MRKIKLTHGKYALVDNEDFDRLNQFNWYLSPDKRGSMYACRGVTVNKKKTYFLMHRVIMNTPAGMCTDHKNRNGLDNRKANLRICTKSQNNMNTPRGNYGKTLSKYKGVTMWKGLWVAAIQANRKKYWLGSHKSERAAHLAYCEASKKYHGEFSCTI